eukprot:4628552-Prymnesium_polylepis.2
MGPGRDATISKSLGTIHAARSGTLAGRCACAEPEAEPGARRPAGACQVADAASLLLTQMKRVLTRINTCPKVVLTHPVACVTNSVSTLKREPWAGVKCETREFTLHAFRI